MLRIDVGQCFRLDFCSVRTVSVFDEKGYTLSENMVTKRNKNATESASKSEASMQVASSGVHASEIRKKPNREVL